MGLGNKLTYRQYIKKFEYIGTESDHCVNCEGAEGCINWFSQPFDKTLGVSKQCPFFRKVRLCSECGARILNRSRSEQGSSYPYYVCSNRECASHERISTANQ